MQKTHLIRITTCAVLLGAAANAAASAPTDDMALKGGQDGTVFRSLTVEGENRVQIHFERPDLGISIDPEAAPGLVLNDALDILDRTLPDLVTPFLATSVRTPYRHGPRPWLQAYGRGPVARFMPELEGVADWKLQVVDSRGITAAVFAGRGDPPREIPWDGTRLDGTPAPPGYTYSFVLEARDEAGNQRRFVGDGFGLPAYRLLGEDGPQYLVSGEQWQQDRAAAGALLLESAGGFNTYCPPTRPIRVVATHRTVAEASRLAQLVAGSLAPLVGGAADRIVVETRVEAGAPAAGTLRLTGGL